MTFGTLLRFLADSAYINYINEGDISSANKIYAILDRIKLFNLDSETIYSTDDMLSDSDNESANIPYTDPKQLLEQNKRLRQEIDDLRLQNNLQHNDLERSKKNNSSRQQEYEITKTMATIGRYDKDKMIEVLRKQLMNQAEAIRQMQEQLDASVAARDALRNKLEFSKAHVSDPEQQKLVEVKTEALDQMDVDIRDAKAQLEVQQRDANRIQQQIKIKEEPSETPSKRDRSPSPKPGTSRGSGPPHGLPRPRRLFDLDDLLSRLSMTS